MVSRYFTKQLKGPPTSYNLISMELYLVNRPVFEI